MQYKCKQDTNLRFLNQGEIRVRLEQQLTREEEVKRYLAACGVMQRRITNDINTLKGHYESYGYKAPPQTHTRKKLEYYHRCSFHLSACPSHFLFSSLCSPNNISLQWWKKFHLIYLSNQNCSKDGAKDQRPKDQLESSTINKTPFICSSPPKR